MIVPHKKLSNIDALQIARFHGFPIKVIMRDGLESIPKIGFYLVNLNKEGESGSHWCGLICREDMAFYFDPYGALPPNDITQKLKYRYKNKVFFSDFIMQDLNSILCGYYVMGLFIIVHSFEKTYSLLDIISHFLDYFEENTKLNDTKLRKLLEKY